MSDYTVRDIARMAGVSIGTVSRVINNADNLDPVLFEKTMSVIRKLNYKPQARGRKPLVEKTQTSTRLISVVSPGMSSSWVSHDLWASYMSGIERACFERKYKASVLMGDTLSPEKFLSGEVPENCAGILLKTGDFLNGVDNYPAIDLPLVGFGAAFQNFPFPQVAIDDFGAGYVATEELIKAGHRRIAFINHVPSHVMFAAREQGYSSAMKKSGFFSSDLIFDLQQAPESVRNPQSSPPDMSEVLERLLAYPEKITALVVANDWGAAGIYKACASKNLQVPNDFSVIGVDNSEKICEILSPGLSSVMIPHSEITYFSTNMLIDIIEGAGQYLKGRCSLQYLPSAVFSRASIKTLL